MKGSLAKPSVCASEGFRVRGSGSVFGLNPGFLTPDPSRLHGIFKAIDRVKEY